MRGFLPVLGASAADSSKALRSLSTILCLVIALPVLVSPRPACGNVLPESAILVHVQAYAPPSGSCDVPLTECHQVNRSTTGTGPMLFQIYVYPTAYVEDHFPIEHLDLSLTWPQSWRLIGFEACAGGSATLESQGAVHPMHLVWPSCPQMTEQIFLAAWIVLDVDQYGKLGFTADYVPLWLGCPPEGFTAQGETCYGEAGVVCEYTANRCAYGLWCTPEFSQNELALTTPEGRAAEGSLSFIAMGCCGPNPPCPLVVTPFESWVSALAVPLEWPHYRLDVTADASRLGMGTYEASVQVSAFDYVARCVQVTLEVTSAAGIADPSPEEATVTSWGRIKSGYR